MNRKYSRRAFGILLPAAAAGRLQAQESSKRLPTKIGDGTKSHAVLDGQTHTGYPVEVHVTELEAGKSPHPPHQHVHEEMFMLQSGQIDATVNGKTQRLTPGSICYVNSGDLHGIVNPGPDKAEYFVIALGQKS